MSEQEQVPAETGKVTNVWKTVGLSAGAFVLGAVVTGVTMYLLRPASS